MSYSEELFYKETNEALSLYVTKERLIEASKGELRSILQLDKYFPKKGEKVDVDINNLSMPSRNFITAIYLKYFAEENEAVLIKDILTQNQKIYDARVKKDDIERLSREIELKRMQTQEKQKEHYFEEESWERDLPIEVKDRNIFHRIVNKIKSFFHR